MTKDEIDPARRPRRRLRYYLLWITSPAETDDGYGAEIADVRLLG